MMSIVAIYNIVNMNTESVWTVLSLISSFGCLIYFMCFIIFVFYRVIKINSIVEKDGPFQSLYNGFDYFKPRARYFYCVFLARRVLMIAIVLGGAPEQVRSPYVQLSFFTLLQVVQLAFLVIVRPYEKFIDNVNSIIIELGYLVNLAITFFLPPAGSNSEESETLGRVMMFVVMVSSNLPVLLTYITLILQLCFRKKKVVPTTMITDNSKVPPPMDHKVIHEETKYKSRKLKGFKEIVNDSSDLSLSRVWSRNNRYLDGSLTTKDFG